MTLDNGTPPKHDLATRWGRFVAYAKFYFDDHGIIRVPWTHTHEIAPGVWRSNQPSPARLERLEKQGIRSVLSLRGRPTRVATVLEREACERLGLTLRFASIGAGDLSSREKLLHLLDTFREIERPFVFHCKSGIDRTGLAAMLYLLAETDTPPEIAREQLSFKYLHLKAGRHGIIDHMADTYLRAWRETGIGIREWIGTEYDPDALRQSYRGRA